MVLVERSRAAARGLLVFYSINPNGADCDKVAVDDSRVEKWTISPPHAIIDALDRF